MSNPELKRIVPHFMTADKLKDECSETVLQQGDGQDNAKSILHCHQKYKKLHSKKVLEIGDCQDSVVAMSSAPFEGGIVKAHSKKVLEIGTGESNAFALSAVNRWYGLNSVHLGYSGMMSAHSKKVLELGNASDNIRALHEVEYFKNLWRPHWDRILEIGTPLHFVIVMATIQNGSGRHKPYGGNRSELIKLAAEQILRKGSGDDNLDALRCADQEFRNGFSRKIIEIGSEEENTKALVFCEPSYEEQHKVRARELRENPPTTTPFDYDSLLSSRWTPDKPAFTLKR